MSAVEQRRHVHLARPRARFLVSDDDLRNLIGRRHTTALHVMLYVRKRAVLKGRLAIAVTNVELERELGVDRRQIQRAKAHLREVGFPIEERLGRHKGRDGKSGNLACLFVLDRREVGPLKAHLELVRNEEHGGAVLDAVLVKEENTTTTDNGYALVVGGGGGQPLARAGPVKGEGNDHEPIGEPATEAPPWDEPARAGSPKRLPGLPAATEFVTELDHLRSWLAAARGKGALSGERATALLDRAAAAWVDDGGSAFTIRLARSLLEEELGLRQLSLVGDVVDGGGEPSRLPRTSDERQATDADTEGDEGTPITRREGSA